MTLIYTQKTRYLSEQAYQIIIRNKFMLQKSDLTFIDLPYFPINVINFGGLKVSWRMERKGPLVNRAGIEMRDKSSFILINPNFANVNQYLATHYIGDFPLTF